MNPIKSSIHSSMGEWNAFLLFLFLCWPWVFFVVVVVVVVVVATRSAPEFRVSQPERVRRLGRFLQGGLITEGSKDLFERRALGWGDGLLDRLAYAYGPCAVQLMVGLVKGDPFKTGIFVHVGEFTDGTGHQLMLYARVGEDVFQCGVLVDDDTVDVVDVGEHHDQLAVGLGGQGTAAPLKSVKQVMAVKHDEHSVPRLHDERVW